MAKARLENGQTVIYNTDTPKPFKIIQGYENGYNVGLTFWGGDALSDEDWKAFGFYPYTAPDIDERVKEVTSITLNTTTEEYEATVADITFSDTLANYKSAKIENLKAIYNEKLAETDWIIIRDAELGNTTDQDVLDDRAALRTACATKESEINALTTKKNVALYDLPNLND